MNKVEQSLVEMSIRNAQTFGISPERQDEMISHMNRIFLEMSQVNPQITPGEVILEQVKQIACTDVERLYIALETGIGYGITVGLNMNGFSVEEPKEHPIESVEAFKSMLESQGFTVHEVNGDDPVIKDFLSKKNATRIIPILIPQTRGEA